MRKSFIPAMLFLAVGVVCFSRGAHSHHAVEGPSYAECTDKHGVTHHAQCQAPYRAYCRQPEPGECQCGCVYPIQ